MPISVIKALEADLLKRADRVVYVSPFTLKSQQVSFVKSAEKMLFLPIPVKNSCEYHRMQISQTDKLKIGYYGAYYSKDRDIMPLVNAVANTSYELEIYGNSDLVLNNSENVRVYGKISYDEVKKREHESDVLVCLCNKHGTQIPGKAYHYAVTDKYILLIVDGEYKEELKAYFKEYNRYIICDNNIDAIKEALMDLKKNSNLCKECKAFSVDVIAKQIIE